jgi:aminoglycoside phosphotransferase (APT) family kinase protein
VYRWLPGETASRESIGDLTAFATGLAAFLAELGRVDPAGGPAPGLHNWYRGGPLRTYDRQTRDALRVLGDRAPAGVCRAVWDDALGAAWDGRPVWFHGDVSANNLLVRHGALAAVIDFGTCGVGDPACDLVIAWTLLSGPSRAAFRDRLAPDPGTWARGRGWALWKALITWAADPDATGPDAADARRVLGEVLTEYAAADGG